MNTSIAFLSFGTTLATWRKSVNREKQEMMRSHSHSSIFLFIVECFPAKSETIDTGTLEFPAKFRVAAIATDIFCSDKSSILDGRRVIQLEAVKVRYQVVLVPNLADQQI